MVVVEVKDVVDVVVTVVGIAGLDDDDDVDVVVAAVLGLPTTRFAVICPQSLGWKVLPLAAFRKHVPDPTPLVPPRYTNPEQYPSP